MSKYTTFHRLAEKRSQMTILVTGATGDIGSKVVKQLLTLGARPRVFVRDAGKARAQFGDRVEIFIGDLADAPSLAQALTGVNKLFLVNSGPRIPALDALAAITAKSARVEQIVKLSSLDVEENLALGVWHAKGEAAIRAADIPFTFVRPSGFMSNLLAWRHSIVGEGVVRSSAGDGHRPFIHSEDIAAVAVQALTSENHIGDSLPLTGPESLSFGEITQKIAAAIGRPLRFEPISDEEARYRFRATGASDEETAAHVELWRAIREERVASVTGGVRHVLGRDPIALDQWIGENAAAFRG
jgi:(4-alkanoyl-5-oxo-2,5-dihydrofuran-3-yl)methyl phosphate reductase